MAFGRQRNPGGVGGQSRLYLPPRCRDRLGTLENPRVADEAGKVQQARLGQADRHRAVDALIQPLTCHGVLGKYLTGLVRSTYHDRWGVSTGVEHGSLRPETAVYGRILAGAARVRTRFGCSPSTTRGDVLVRQGAAAPGAQPSAFRQAPGPRCRRANRSVGTRGRVH